MAKAPGSSDSTTGKGRLDKDKRMAAAACLRKGASSGLIGAVVHAKDDPCRNGSILREEVGQAGVDAIFLVSRRHYYDRVGVGESVSLDS